jgi:hypothetical protein
MIMDCKNFKLQAWPYHEKALSQKEVEACEAHLAICGDCRSIVAGISLLGKHIDTARRAEPDAFAATRIAASIESAMEREEKHVSFLSIPVLKPLLISFALLAGIILGLTGASFRLRHTGMSSQPDATIQTMRSDLYLTDLMDEDRILTLTPPK